MPKKNKPVTRPIRIPKEEEIVAQDLSTVASGCSSGYSSFSCLPAAVCHGRVERQQLEGLNHRREPVPSGTSISLADLLEEIDIQNPTMDLPNHPFFDPYKLNPAAKMPLEYGPLVHALSALSVGGGSFCQ